MSWLHSSDVAGIGIDTEMAAKIYHARRRAYDLPVKVTTYGGKFMWHRRGTYNMAHTLEEAADRIAFTVKREMQCR